MKSIELSSDKFAVVDDCDFDKVSQFKWFAFKTKKGHTFYAARTVEFPDGRKTSQLMHRFILGLTDPKKRTDHRDHDGLNNTRVNLRVCTHQQNQCNVLKRNREFKGVTLEKRTGKYFARVMVNREVKHLGTFARPEDAARAYNAAALKHFGEFACLNTLPDEAAA